MIFFFKGGNDHVVIFSMLYDTMCIYSKYNETPMDEEEIITSIVMNMSCPSPDCDIYWTDFVGPHDGCWYRSKNCLLFRSSWVHSYFLYTYELLASSGTTHKGEQLLQNLNFLNQIWTSGNRFLERTMCQYF